MFGAASRQGDGLGWRRGGKLGEGKGREGEVEGRERKGPKLLLNQGPSEPCYATDTNCIFAFLASNLSLLLTSFPRSFTVPVRRFPRNVFLLLCSYSCLLINFIHQAVDKYNKNEYTKMNTK